MAHEPKRSTAKKVTTTEVFKNFGGLTSQAKAGRNNRVSERRPFRTNGSPTRN